MLDLLWMIPALPLAGFVALAFGGRRLSRRGVAIVGVGSVGAAALVALLAAAALLAAPPAGRTFTQTLWTWFAVGDFAPRVALTLDPLSLVMVLVVTVVGFLIHLYSTEFMADDEGYARFFAYMNLFVCSMLVLVLADDLLLLYLGWEGVGLCSYLLIGFWYRDPTNGRAARKAFVVTRVGDTAMALGLFLVFTQLGTSAIPEAMRLAAERWPAGSGMAVAAALLLLGGAVGKSAQLPLQTWLPDAMAGPTPVSALIHAATMVTAGVYLIARTHVLFELAPSVQALVAVIGAATMLLAGSSALVQRDIKRVLAYSTISQLGYMFLALGVGAWTAAIFHFATHAFFKSLLFLGAGVVIAALHHEHDLFRMGGLRKELPLAFWCFLIGAASLAALPLVTAGFYSKDLILARVWASPRGGPWLWGAGVAGALLTSLYAFRLVFLAFFGPLKRKPERQPGLCMLVPLVVLAILSLVGGFIETPRTLGGVSLFSGLLRPVFPGGSEGQMGMGLEALLQLAAAAASLAGVYLAYVLVLRRRAALESRLLLTGWGFDWLYDALFVRPFVWLARVNRNDVVDRAASAIAWVLRAFHHVLAATQTGKLRWYAAGLAVGVILALRVLVFT